jgi:hypothetical protein
MRCFWEQTGVLGPDLSLAGRLRVSTGLWGNQWIRRPAPASLT